ncbi:MAG: nonstructural protein [Microviridae sp.]|nr:MAG: nonstructural protein [Microviridae sp.]
MQPFAGPDHKAVLSSIARIVNQGEATSDIAQAPHHYEVWQLGIVQDGHITPEREFITDCSSLLRAGIRAPRDDNRPETAAAENESRRPIGGLAATASPNTGPLPIAAHAAPREAQEVVKGPAGGYPPRNSLDG